MISKKQNQRIFKGQRRSTPQSLIYHQVKEAKLQITSSASSIIWCPIVEERRKVDGGYQSIVPLPLKIHRDGYHFPGQQFIWDEKSKRVLVRERGNWKFTILYLFCFMLLSIHAIHYFASKHDILKIVYACTLFEYCFEGIVPLYFMTRHSKEFADFLNGCRELEKVFYNGGVHLSKSRLISFLIQLTGKVFPVVFATAAFLLPCFPLNYFAAAFAQNDLCCMQGQGGYYVNVALWQKAISATLSWFVFASVYNIGLTATTHILIGVWFQITALNGYEEFLKPKRKSSDIIILYRQMQILNKWFNLSNETIILYVLSGITCIATLWAFVVVRAPASVMSSPVRLAVLEMLIQLSWMLLIVCEFAGNIHTKSRKIFAHVKGHGFSRANPALKKAIKSCPPLKIGLGSSNFIEKETPLKCFEFSLTRFADLLLTEKQWKKHFF